MGQGMAAEVEEGGGCVFGEDCRQVGRWKEGVNAGQTWVGCYFKRWAEVVNGPGVGWAEDLVGFGFGFGLS